MNKHIRLPKEGLVEPEERAGRDGFVDDNDLEGHGLPTTAPPAAMPSRRPGHGGENIPTTSDDGDDVEAHGAPTA